MYRSRTKKLWDKISGTSEYQTAIDYLAGLTNADDGWLCGFAAIPATQNDRTRRRTFNISDPAEEQKCLSLGACDFLIKSHLDSTELGNIVLKYVSK